MLPVIRQLYESNSSSILKGAYGGVVNSRASFHEPVG